MEAKSLLFLVKRKKKIKHTFMKNKKNIVALTVLILSSIILYVSFASPIVFKKSKVNIQKNYYSQPELKFNPFENFDFNKGNWEAYLIIDKYDFDKLNSKIRPARVLKSKSKDTLNKLKKGWILKATNGDMATASSSIVIKHDGIIVFESGVVLENDLLGLQNKQFGWAEPDSNEQFIEGLSEFEKVSFPIVLI